MKTKKLRGARYAWTERTPFTIRRPEGLSYITFLHFDCEVELLSDGEYKSEKPGACIFYGPYEPQWFRCEKGLIHDWIHFDSSLLLLLQEEDIKTSTVYRPKNSAFIGKIVRELELEHFSKHSDSDAYSYHKLSEFIIRFGRAIREETELNLSCERYTSLRTVRRELLTRCREPWTVTDMAELAGMSTSRFHAVYSKAFGSSPMDDIIEERLRCAKDLLLSTELTVGEIARDCGYESESHFIRQFRKRVGISPGKYKNK